MESWNKQVLAAISFLCLLTLLVRLYNSLVAEPKRLRSLLWKQGVRGPPTTFLLGNILEIRDAQKKTKKAEANLAPGYDTAKLSHRGVSDLFVFLDHWRKQYGDVFMFALGTTQILCVVQPDLVKEITTCTSLDFGKPSYQQRDRGPLLGQGILTSNGAIWAHQRKTLAPELYMDKVKGMMSLIVESTERLIESWKSVIDAAEGGVADIKISEHMRRFSGDVISKACFGSNYAKGEEIFLKLRALEESMSKSAFLSAIPGIRHFPTRSNIEAWTLEKDIHNLIIQVANDRNQTTLHEEDLLQMVLEGAKTADMNKQDMDRFIVDNCKNIYLAGYETTAVSATWCLMLLASDQEWQDLVRAEVMQLCHNNGIPEFDSLHKMKQLTMVIYESLRLYPPVTVISREALKELKFGNIKLPRNVNVWTMVTALHTDPNNWGPDAFEFNPNRFTNGITGACKYPHCFMPFGVGPRICLGQNLAMVELKILISLIISNFSLSLSPSYSHSPKLKLVIEPEFDVQLLIKKL